MKTSKLLAAMRELCDELGPEDGVDPRKIKRDRAREARRRDDRKTLQLCGQVSRVLSLCLGSSGDPVLAVLLVDHVAPAPDASRLRVVVTCHRDEPCVPGEVLAALAAAAPWLRAEVSRSIHRKRVPSLIFDWRAP